MLKDFKCLKCANSTYYFFPFIVALFLPPFFRKENKKKVVSKNSGKVILVQAEIKFDPWTKIF